MMAMINFPVSIHTEQFLQPERHVEVYYPVVTRQQDPGIELRINRDIHAALEKLMNENSLHDPYLHEMLGYYELKNNQRGILSLSMINYAYTGGAHGMTYIRSLTFNVSSGKQYTLRELFKPGTDYVQRLSDIVQQQIKARNIQLLGEFESIRHDQDYYIADKSLVIYFQLYEITPYVAGFQYFPISIYDIQDIIDEEGPLGRMIH
jgi:hypothetical protein